MEIIKLGQKIAQKEEVQAVHYENINNKDYLFVVYKDWKKGGEYINIEQAKEFLK